jgi:hypothetical protein
MRIFRRKLFTFNEKNKSGLLVKWRIILGEDR